MSLHEYIASKEIARDDPPFYGVLMALMRMADSRNSAILRDAYPRTWAELQARYDAPGGRLPGEKGFE